MNAAAAFQKIADGIQGTDWTATLEVVSGFDVAVLVRRVSRRSQTTSKPPCSGSSRDTASGSCVTKSLENPRDPAARSVRPYSPMGVQTGLAGTATASVPSQSAASPHIPSFGDLATVRAMGTGETAPVIGFDTEFTYQDDGSRVIDSYQFSVLDPEDPSLLVNVTLIPLHPLRVAFADALAVVICESGLWRAAGLRHPRGVPRRDFWVDGDYRSSVDALYKQSGVEITLAGHYLNADLTAFAQPAKRRGGERYDDILRRVTSASGGLVSLKPVRMIARSGSGSGARWLPLAITIRDTMGQSAPGQKSLANLGNVSNVLKLEVGDAIEDMTAYREAHLLDFLEYGANDADIVLEYLTALWGPNATPPVTLSGGGAHALREGVKRYWGIGHLSNAMFKARFQGLVNISSGDVSDDDGLSYYSVRSLTPVDGDANQAHSAFKQSFHGGYNACLSVGVFVFETFDHDIQSAYPSAMASIVDVDFENGVIEEVIKDRELTLDDFPLGVVTPLVAYVRWEFPPGVEPTLPVRVGQSIIYPRTSEGAGASQGDGMEGIGFDAFEGAWCCGPELFLALKLGARVEVQHGFRLRVLEHDGVPSRSMRAAVKQMVEDRATAKQIWGKGSLVELMIKVATNSCYGKLAQDVAERSGWNSWAEEMEGIGGSSVTSPYHAAMITSLVRALLLGMSNEISLFSATTDGFITSEPDVEQFDCFGIAEVFRDAREALVGNRTVWEIKHQQTRLLNLTTRGNVSNEDGGVLAKAGIKTPRRITRGSLNERRWFQWLAISREGKVPNPYTSFPSFRELSRSENRIDFHPVERRPKISLDFDMKRRPLLDTLRINTVHGYEVAGFDTVAWESVTEYARAREIARHIAAMRPGTTGENRPTGCLRTEADWRTWERRYLSNVGRRVRTADAALLTELVAAHKEGIVTIPELAARIPVEQKLAWLSTLGHGEFTRAQWEHMSKRDRRARVLDDLNPDELTEIVERLHASRETGNGEEAGT